MTPLLPFRGNGDTREICFAALRTFVGYQNLEAYKGGHKMLVPTFLDVSGSTNGYVLADLRVTGYPDLQPGAFPGTFTGGCGGGQFIIRQLTLGGKYEAEQYYWIDNGKIGPGWFADAAGAEITGGPKSVKFPANKGLWVYSASGTQGDSQWKLVGSGSVNFEEVRFTAQKGGHTAMGNGTPVDLTLADLTVTGYPDLQPGAFPGTFIGGCGGGQFIVRQLTAGGKYEAAQYYWIDNGKIGPGWFADAAGTAISGGAGSVPIEAGKGLWVYCAAGTQGDKWQLIIPGVDLSKK